MFVTQCASLEEQQSVSLTDRLTQSSTVMLKWKLGRQAHNKNKKLLTSSSYVHTHTRFISQDVVRALSGLVQSWPYSHLSSFDFSIYYKGCRYSTMALCSIHVVSPLCVALPILSQHFWSSWWVYVYGSASSAISLPACSGFTAVRLAGIHSKLWIGVFSCFPLCFHVSFHLSYEHCVVCKSIRSHINMLFKTRPQVS